MANAWQDAATTLFRELFEGQPEGQTFTYVVEKREGIFDALDSIDAARASHRAEAGSPTLAAHTYHLLYSLRLANSYQGRPKPEGDWESSWAVQDATPEEWEHLKAHVREEYALVLPFLATSTPPNDEATTGMLGMVVHASYHLGAMRALLRLV
ncbi:hypothetical protein EON79_23385 [bacterium]|nr:MAG: hypothetical protein EON79_23385 [bacterium]